MLKGRLSATSQFVYIKTSVFPFRSTWQTTGCLWKIQAKARPYPGRWLLKCWIRSLKSSLISTSKLVSYHTHDVTTLFLSLQLADESSVLTPTENSFHTAPYIWLATLGLLAWLPTAFSDVYSMSPKDDLLPAFPWLFFPFWQLQPFTLRP